MQNANITMMTIPRPDFGVRAELIFLREGSTTPFGTTKTVSMEKGQASGENVAEETPTFTLQVPSADTPQTKGTIRSFPPEVWRSSHSTKAEPEKTYVYLNTTETTTSDPMRYEKELPEGANSNTDQVPLKQPKQPFPAEATATLIRSTGGVVDRPQISNGNNSSPNSPISPHYVQGAARASIQHATRPQSITQPNFSEETGRQIGAQIPENVSHTEFQAVTVPNKEVQPRGRVHSQIAEAPGRELPKQVQPSPSEPLTAQRSPSGKTTDTPVSSKVVAQYAPPISDNRTPVLELASGIRRVVQNPEKAISLPLVAPALDNSSTSNKPDLTAQKSTGAELFVSDSKSIEPSRMPIASGYRPEAAPDQQKTKSDPVANRHGEIQVQGNPATFDRPDATQSNRNPSPPLLTSHMSGFTEKFDTQKIRHTGNSRPENTATFSKPDAAQPNQIPSPPLHITPKPEMNRVSVWQGGGGTPEITKSNLANTFEIKPNKSEPISNTSTIPASPFNTAGEVAQFSGLNADIGEDLRHLPISTIALMADTPIPQSEAALSRHIASQIADIAKPVPDRPIDLTLNPEELGRIRLSFNTENGVLSVSVTAERPETLDLMRRHIETLAQELRNIGYRDVNIGFGQEGKNPSASTFGQSAENGKEPSADAQTDPEDSSNTHLMTSTSNLHGETGIDLRL